MPMQRPSPDDPPTTATRSEGLSDIELLLLGQRLRARYQKAEDGYAICGNVYFRTVER
jgi:hypothetical protein